MRTRRNSSSSPSDAPPGAVPWTEAVAAVRPMLATLADPPLVDSRLAYEAKYDGIRALVQIEPGTTRGRDAQPQVVLWSRQGNQKTSQFPELATEFQRLGRTAGRPLL